MKTSRGMPLELAIAVLVNLIAADIVILLVIWPWIAQRIAKLG